MIMKLAIWIGIVLCSTYLLFPCQAHAETHYFNDEEEIKSALALEGWLSQADAKWQISFPYVTGTGQPGTIQSRLDFQKINSPVIIYTAGGRVNGAYSFDVLYGTGTISGGRGIDTDRFIPDSGSAFDFSQSTNDIRGNVREWGINLYYNNKRFGSPQAGSWGMVLGYLHYQDSLRMTNGIQTLPYNFDGLIQPAGPFPGLNSTYNFTWNLLRIGALYQPKLTEQLSLSGTVSIYPYASYEGDGFWNLRAGTNPSNFRTQSPNFIQTASAAYGYDASLGLTYLISENLELTVGYRYFYLYARNGTDTTYFSDGSEYQDRLDWVTVTRQGTYAAAVLKF
jgi:hypothetical protein